MKKKQDCDTERRQCSRIQTCRNCGVNGHLYKDCIHPITSFGIICYKVDDRGEVQYLMIQRKDSLSFMEFIRGKYSIYDFNYIKKLVSSMTLNEKNILSNRRFDEIWNYAWYQNNASSIKHTTEYIESKYKYEYVKDNMILREIMKSDIDNVGQEQEWGFPKGRRKVKETDKDCAVREFCEETRLRGDDIEILSEILPFEEIFFGTNSVLYKHTYYIAKIKDSNVKLKVDENCLEQIREVRALNWFSYADVVKHIKVHNIERHQIINRTDEIVRMHEKIM